MTRAGFARREIGATLAGAPLMGYANRAGGATGVHDPLHVRALVVEAGGEAVALCSVDLCAVNEDVVAAARARVAAESGIAPERTLIAATHTHSAPHDDDRACWPDGLAAEIAAAVAQASARMAPATVGAGWGTLSGHAVNRRRLEDPVDPAVFVLRVDRAYGAPLGVYFGFGCHPVVLGPDSRAVSGDWPATASRVLESELGPDAVAVFAQGACADVNPLTDGVRERIAAASTVSGQLEAVPYYGSADGAGEPFDVGDRTGGTFAEAERLGRAIADEVRRVHRGLAPTAVTGVWTRRLALGRPPGAEPREPGPLGDHGVPRAGADAPIELLLVGLDGPGVVLVGQPGEVFGQTGVDLRRALRARGARHPFVVGYANGWRAYLPPADAWPDGGYEVDWARAQGLAPSLQDDARTLILNAYEAQTKDEALQP
ncbi:hypothetical protein DSM104299_02172 [Baekduia alba]|uniref:neutral/alkaline non-lysosomal ceramidase N-terminal domain-containing protein n=1 Tax=Baekduia alba TaxID=2997333 RepID=UPI00233FD537|nr:neutral/alkaline non-lysosomal ceramidase N-terminal domain-containing protein [Baekduia alba]WCB93459.1 hypothetical protein DSM104299_02172 [Baekduia alba]